MDLQGFTAVETSMQTIFQFSTICVAILVEYNPVAYFKTSLNSEHCTTELMLRMKLIHAS